MTLILRLSSAVLPAGLNELKGASTPAVENNFNQEEIICAFKMVLDFFQKSNEECTFETRRRTSLLKRALFPLCFLNARYLE